MSKPFTRDLAARCVVLHLCASHSGFVLAQKLKYWRKHYCGISWEQYLTKTRSYRLMDDINRIHTVYVSQQYEGDSPFTMCSKIIHPQDNHHDDVRAFHQAYRSTYTSTVTSRKLERSDIMKARYFWLQRCLPIEYTTTF